MIERESITQTCPHCGSSFRVLADEYGDHDCPGCGFSPGDEALDFDDDTFDFDEVADDGEV